MKRPMTASPPTSRSSAVSSTTTRSGVETESPLGSWPGPWTGEPHEAESDRREGPFRAPVEKPAPDRGPRTAAVFHLLAHGPSRRALNRPGSGGAR
jgi:hypothetical protein